MFPLESLVRRDGPINFLFEFDMNEKYTYTKGEQVRDKESGGLFEFSYISGTGHYVCFAKRIGYIAFTYDEIEPV